MSVIIDFNQVDNVLAQQKTLQTQALDAFRTSKGYASALSPEFIRYSKGNATFGEALGAAFLQENILVSGLSRISPTFTPVPGFNNSPEHKAMLGPFKQYVDNFPELLTAESPKELLNVQRKIQKEIESRTILENVGFFEGLLYYLPAGILSPENLLPIATAVKGVGLGAKTVGKLSAARAAAARTAAYEINPMTGTVARTAAGQAMSKEARRALLLRAGMAKNTIPQIAGLSAAEGALSGAVAEVILNAQQGLRTSEEMVMGVVGGGVFGSILGTGFAGIGKGYRASLEQLIGHEYLTDAINDANVQYSRALVNALDENDVDVAQALRELQKGIEGNAQLKAQEAWEKAIEVVDGKVAGPIKRLAGFKEEGWLSTIAKKVAWLNPNIQLALSKSNRAYSLGEVLASSPLIRVADDSLEKQGEFTRPAIESMIHLVELDAFRKIQTVNTEFKTYKKGGGKLDQQTFNELVGRLHRRGGDFTRNDIKDLKENGSSHFPGVERLDDADLALLKSALIKSSKATGKFFDSIKQLAMQTGAFTRVSDSETVGNIVQYFAREYDIDKIKLDREGFAQVLRDGRQRSIEGKKKSLQLRMRSVQDDIVYLNERIRQGVGDEADRDTMTALIEHSKELKEEYKNVSDVSELKIQETIDKILGEAESTNANPNNGTVTARIKNFLERTLDISDEDLEDFLISDADYIMGKMVRHTLPDLLLAQYLGSSQVSKLLMETEAQLIVVHKLNKIYQEDPSDANAKSLVKHMQDLRTNLNKLNMINAFRTVPETTRKDLQTGLNEILDIEEGEFSKGAERISQMFDERNEIQEAFNKANDEVRKLQMEYTQSRERTRQLREQLSDTSDFDNAVTEVIKAADRAELEKLHKEDMEEAVQARLEETEEYTNAKKRAEDADADLIQAEVESREDNKAFSNAVAKQFADTIEVVQPRRAGQTAKEMAEVTTLKEAKPGERPDSPKGYVLYHGTGSKVSFAEISSKAGGRHGDAGALGQAFYVTIDPSIARDYANMRSGAGDEPSVIQVGLGEMNVRVIDERGPDGQRLAEELGVEEVPTWNGAQQTNKAWSEEFAEKAKKAGIDAIYTKDTGEVAVFSTDKLVEVSSTKAEAPQVTSAAEFLNNRYNRATNENVASDGLEFDSKDSTVRDSKAERKRAEERAEWARNQTELEYLVGAIEELLELEALPQKVDVKDLENTGTIPSIRKNGDRLVGHTEASEGDLVEYTVKVAANGTLIRYAKVNGKQVRVKRNAVTHIHGRKKGEVDKLPSNQALSIIQAGGKFRYVDELELENAEVAALILKLPEIEDAEVRQKVEKQIAKKLESVEEMRNTAVPARNTRGASSQYYFEDYLDFLEKTILKPAPEGSGKLFQVQEKYKLALRRIKFGYSSAKTEDLNNTIQQRLKAIDKVKRQAQKEMETIESKTRKKIEREFTLDKEVNEIMEDFVGGGVMAVGSRGTKVANKIKETLETYKVKEDPEAKGAGKPEESKKPKKPPKPFIETIEELLYAKNKTEMSAETRTLQSEIEVLLRKLDQKRTVRKRYAEKRKEVDSRIYRLSQILGAARNAGNGHRPVQFNYDTRTRVRGVFDPQKMASAVEGLIGATSTIRRNSFRDQLSLDPHFRVIDMEYKREIEKATTTKQIGRLEKDRERDKELIATMVSRLRNTDGFSDEAQFVQKASRILRNYNYLRSMGGVVISSIPDIVMGISTAGFSNYARAWAKFIQREWTEKGKHRDDMAMLLWAGETVLGRNRAASVFDTEQPYRRTAGSGLMDKMDYIGGVAADRFSRLSGTNLWNGMMKSISAVAIQSRIIQISKRRAAGKSVSKSDQAFMNFIGINNQTAVDIARIHDGMADATDNFMGHTFYYSKSDKWSGNINGVSANRVDNAKNIMEAAVRTGVNNTVLTPNAGVIPPELTTWWGRLLNQFRSFMLQSTETIVVSGSQRAVAAKDMNQVITVLGLTFMGTMVYALKEALMGRDAVSGVLEGDEEQIRKVLFNGLDRGGALALPMEMNNIIHSLAGGGGPINKIFGVSEEAGRFRQRDFISTISAPMGTVEDVAKAVTSLFSRGMDSEEDLFKGDRTRLRRVMPYQNLWWLSVGLDVVPNFFGSGTYYEPNYRMEERVYELIGGEPEPQKQG